MPPTTTSVPPPRNMSSSSPCSRNSALADASRPANGSLPRAKRSTTEASASSRRRAGPRLPSGARADSCSGVARCVSGRPGVSTRSELEYLPVLQHARPVGAGAFLDLLHGELDLAGLQVRDPDLGIAVE